MNFSESKRAIQIGVKPNARSAATLAQHADHFGVRALALTIGISRETVARYIARLPLLPSSLGKVARYLVKAGQ